jgi:AraC-like DNA-binding protein
MTDTTGFCLIYREAGDLVIREGDAATAPGAGVRVWTAPRHVLNRHLPDLPRPLMVRIPVVETLAALAVAYLEALAGAAEALSEGEAAMVTDTLARLAATAMAYRGAGRLHDQSIGAARQDQARRYVRRHLSSPKLDPQMVAQGLGISPRQLHLLFKPTGETFGQHVRRLRLEECRAALRNPLAASRSVADIAYGWGFASLPTFYRAFHAAYGVAPGDLREPVARSETTSRLK